MVPRDEQLSVECRISPTAVHDRCTLAEAGRALISVGLAADTSSAVVTLGFDTEPVAVGCSCSVKPLCFGRTVGEYRS